MSTAVETSTRDTYDAVVFNDRLSNITMSAAGSYLQQATYFEGTNVYVYIRGVEDDSSDFWTGRDPRTLAMAEGAKSMKKRLVLVNSHFDSVPSSYGATDDGVGILTGLQLLRYFT